MAVIVYFKLVTELIIYCNYPTHWNDFYPYRTMGNLQRTSLAEQTAYFMQEKIEAGHWRGPLPGVMQLAKELGVSKVTVQAAFALLEKRGFLISHGLGKRREAVPIPAKETSNRSLRIGILLRTDFVHHPPTTQEILFHLKHDLEVMGHVVFHAPKCQTALGLNPTRIASMLAKHTADVWIVAGGTYEILSWFKQQPLPFLALGGVYGDISMATCAMRGDQAMKDALDRLVALGHRRIVKICAPDWVRPSPTRVTRIFLDHLKHLGVPAGDYNIPYHDETPAGFQKLLESLFKVTPPTALIVPSIHYAFAVMSFASFHGLCIPRDLSLISCSPSPLYQWAKPQIAHYQHDISLMVRRVVRWVEACAIGSPDREQKWIEATLFTGETIAPPPMR